MLLHRTAVLEAVLAYTMYYLPPLSASLCNSGPKPLPPNDNKLTWQQKELVNLRNLMTLYGIRFDKILAPLVATCFLKDTPAALRVQEH